MRRSSCYGFTLIELIVVIAIIAILAAVIAPNAFKAIEKSKIAQSISHSKTIKTAALAYYGDTGQWPTMYRLTTVTNPFMVDPGISGWDGPYVESWKAHAWAGHAGWDPTIDLDDNGFVDGCVVFDDDRPGTGPGDNQGRIPATSMEKIDSTVDDGDLANGTVQGNGLGLHSALGELVIMVVHDNQI